jgi:hypothetical protein
MSRTQLIIIFVGVIAVGVSVFTGSKDNEFTDHEVALDSSEAKAALSIFEKLAESTNHLVANLSADAPPIARQKLLHAQQLTQADTVKLKEASWRGEYLSVAVTCSPAAEHWFYLAEDEAGQLKLLGVQQ